MTQSQAWLLDCGSGMVVATGLGNVLHVVEDGALLFRVPLAPAHCNRVMIWRGRVLPVVDLAALITGTTPATQYSYACVLGWRDGSDTEYGVLLTRGLPRRITVSDEQQTAPAGNAESWRGLALGFFTYYKRITPIVDPAAIFGARQSTDTSAAQSTQLIA